MVVTAAVVLPPKLELVLVFVNADMVVTATVGLLSVPE
uniref:Uncharacterized protein n=1 Tax=Anguilla anguilla TaxID=7936 RepID=A0A0E9WNG2_ANGAN